MVAAVFIWIVLTLPPAALRPNLPRSPLMATGALHVHTERSDGWGSVEAVAQAAAAAGLQFVVLTDHGDASRAPEPPAYRHGVLCIDAVEVSATGGHLIALGLWDAAPYPLGGDARDVAEDIHRLGGRAIAAHMDSPKDDLRWTAPAALADGIEWLNLDSEWRRHPIAGLGPSVGRLLMRPAETVASLFGDGRAMLEEWDRLLQVRDVFSVAALDAHTSVPSYEALFNTATQTVVLDAPLSGQPVEDARRVVAALSAGRSFSMIRAFIDAPHAFEFSASRPGGARVGVGQRLGQTADVALRAAVPAAIGGVSVQLVHNGTNIGAQGTAVDHVASAPGVYRALVTLPDRRVPWIVSNPIYVGERPGAPPKAAGEPQDRTIPVNPLSWAIETHPDSRASLGKSGNDVRFSYQLGPSATAGQFAAIAAPGVEGVRAVELVASSRRPIRISVQVRVADGRRWRRSVYLDATPRRIVIPISEMTSTIVGGASLESSATIASLLLVVDTVNSAPGAGGEVDLRSAAFRSAR